MVPRSTPSGKCWNVPRRQLKLHQSRHRSEQFLVRARAHLGCNRCTESHGRCQHRGRHQEIGISGGPPAESAAASSRQRCRGCRHCSPNLCRFAGPTPMTMDNPSSKRARLREDFVPSCVEEMQQWVWDRQLDLQAATLAGRLEEVGRISQLIIRGAQQWHGVQAEQTTVGSCPCMLPSTVGLVVR